MPPRNPWSHDYVDNTNALGFGIYCLESWAKNEQTRYSAFSAYYRGTPEIERVNLRRVPQSSNPLVVFRSRQADVVTGLTPREFVSLLRKGARELLQSAVEAELEVFMARFRDRKPPEGHASAVRNGHHPERAVQTGIGPVTVKLPKVRSNTGKPVAFYPALVPPHGLLTATHRSAARPSQRGSNGDPVLGIALRTAQGLELSTPPGMECGPYSAILGHWGAGGAQTLADPRTSITFAYLTGDMADGMGTSLRAARLVRAVYTSLNRRSK